MPFDTYDELQASVLSWLARSSDDEDEVVARVPDFIRLGEARFNGDLRVRQMQERIAARIDEPVEKMAARFLAPVSANLISPDGSAVIPLIYMDLHELSRGLRNRNGDPVAYTIAGGEILFGPKIDYDDTVDPATLPSIELFGYFAQEPLSDANPENDILKYYPNVYLYSALIEAAAFITLDQITTWINFYDDAIAKANDTAAEQSEQPRAPAPADHVVV